MHILITGGAGFVGSNLAVMFAGAGDQVTCLDNLHRRGSEFSLSRLRAAGVDFIHGDVRNIEDFEAIPAADVVIECAAEPSVHAGYMTGVRYLMNTNLVGAFNCLEYCRRHQSALIFLSTSRVYSIAGLRGLPLRRHGERLVLPPGENGAGWSEQGINEDFPTAGPRSLYGATKLSAELLVEEYNTAYGLKTVINRCGVLTGPWQMGKVDQGFFVLWAARHLYGGALAYTGFGGEGHQVRDVLHVADLYDLLRLQLAVMDVHSGRTYNVGGGREVSVSLAELTKSCAARTGRTIDLGSVPETQPADIPFYITDTSRVRAATGWSPTRPIPAILDEVLEWLALHQRQLQPILS